MAAWLHEYVCEIQTEVAHLMEGLTTILQDPRICKKNPDETQKFKLLSEYAGYVALFL
jgi:hypothetical protein